VALGEFVASEGSTGFIHFPTTAHAVMQRASISAGGRETGVMLAYLPPEARDLRIGTPAQARLAVTVVYQPLVEAPPQAIHLPQRYRRIVLEIAEEVGLTRTAAPTSLSTNVETVLDSSFDASRGLQQISIDRIGAGVAEKVTGLMSSAAATLVHVDLPMNDPSIHDAVEQLRGVSFAFAGWLPGWSGHDVLRMQYLASPSTVELAPSLYSAEAAALMDMIRSELVDRS
jgi:hypothetical protein